ncbi:putative translation elongation factor EF1B/ribosomal protein S6 [Helianthus debilis subsp. tardiflorus]
MFVCAFEQHREKGVATLLLVALAIYDVPGLPPLNIIGHILFAFFVLVVTLSAGKSSNIKPWDDETDMQKLEEAVRSVQMEGLLWGAWYGIKKLQIMLTTLDDLVSVVDTLIEEHLTVEPINEYVQSCEIVAFNKI